MQVPVCPELTTASVVRGLWLRPQPPLMDNSAPFSTRPLALIYRGYSVQTNRATSKRAATRRRLETIRMIELFWTPEAIQDCDEIYDHIEADNQAAALALDELFSEKASRLVVARGYNG